MTNPTKIFEDNRTFRHWQQQYAHGTHHLFDVILPALIQHSGEIVGWALERTQLTKSGISITHFKGPTKDGPWEAALNPYAGTSLKPEELALISGVMAGLAGVR